MTKQLEKYRLFLWGKDKEGEGAGKGWSCRGLRGQCRAAALSQIPTTFLKTTPLTPTTSCPRPTLDLESEEKHAFTSAGTNWSSVHVHGHPGDFPGAWVGHATND